MNKKSIVYNHIKKINEARKIGKKGCYSCIFNMSNRELSSALDIEEDIILSPCPLAAYTLFTYGFINKSTYIAATKKMYEKKLRRALQFFKQDKKVFYCSRCAKKYGRLYSRM